MSLLENLIASAVATSEISESDLLFLFSKGERKVYTADEYLFREEEPSLWVGIIEDGLVEIVKEKGDVNALIAVLSKGATIAEAVITGSASHDVSAYTRKGATVWQVPIDMLQATFQIHPDIYFRLITRFALKQRYAANQLGQTQDILRTEYDQILKEGWVSKDTLDYILKPMSATPVQ